MPRGNVGKRSGNNGMGRYHIASSHSNIGIEPDNMAARFFKIGKRYGNTGTRASNKGMGMGKKGRTPEIYTTRWAAINFTS